jgi:hypothetical protein
MPSTLAQTIGHQLPVKSITYISNKGKSKNVETNTLKNTLHNEYEINLINPPQKKQ